MSNNPHSDQEIERWVERFRVRLELLPWGDQAKWAANLVERHGLIPNGRRSGRTTRGLLTAIARAHLDGASTIAINASPSANMDECVRIAKNLIMIWNSRSACLLTDSASGRRVLRWWSTSITTTRRCRDAG